MRPSAKLWRDGIEALYLVYLDSHMTTWTVACVKGVVVLYKDNFIVRVPSGKLWRLLTRPNH